MDWEVRCFWRRWRWCWFWLVDFKKRKHTTQFPQLDICIIFNSYMYMMIYVYLSIFIYIYIFLYIHQINDIQISTATKETNLMKRPCLLNFIPTANLHCFFMMNLHQPSSSQIRKFYPKLLFKVIFYGFYHGKPSLKHHLGNEKKHGCLGFCWGWHFLPSHIRDYSLFHKPWNKDPYESTRMTHGK